MCEDGQASLVEFAGDGSTAAAPFSDRKVTLPQTISRTDIKWSDGGTRLYLDGPLALLESSWPVLARGCVQRQIDAGDRL